MHDLTGFQRDLLFIVGGYSEPAGVTIKDDIEEYYGKEVHYGRLYSVWRYLRWENVTTSHHGEGRL
jgi:hypothetical protein